MIRCKDEVLIVDWLEQVVQKGNGPQVPENCVVYLRYQGYFEYQEVPFDSTLMQCEAKGDDSLRINLANGGLIPGLHLGVLSMCKGEKAEFLIHPDYAYGKMGCPPRIPQGKILKESVRSVQ